MPLLAVLDEGAHGALDESLKTLYVQNSETKQFYLDVAPDEAAKIAFNLQTQFNAKKKDLERVHGEKTAAETKLKAYEGLGKSADELKTALETSRPEEVTKLLTQKDEEKRLAVESFESTIATEKAAREKYQQQLHRNAVDAHISKLSLQFDLNDTAGYVLRDYYKANEDGEGNVKVSIYENGNPSLVANQPKTDEQLLAGFREAKQFLSIFNAGDGGGSNAPARQGANNGSKQYEGLSAVEKLNLARANGVTT